MTNTTNITEPAFLPEKDYMRLSLDDRMKYSKLFTELQGRICDMTPSELLNFVSLERSMFKHNTTFESIVVNMNNDCVNDMSVLQTLFRVYAPKNNYMKVVSEYERFSENYSNSSAFKNMIDSYCTYHCIDIDCMEIDLPTLKMMCGMGMLNIGAINNLLETFSERLCDVDFDEDSAVALTDAVTAYSDNSYTLMALSEQTLKKMCRSSSFRRVLTEAFTKVSAIKDSTSMSMQDAEVVRNKLLPHEDKIIKVYRFSKLIR